MADVLIPVWIGLLFVGPILSFVFSLGGEFVSKRTALQLTAGAAVVFGLSLTPLSLPGHELDLAALGLAYGAACVAVGALPNTWFQRFGVVVAMLILAVPGVFVVLSAAHPASARTVTVGCGQRVRFEPWGWVATGGEASILLWRPWWSPLEVERSHKQFDWGTYPELNGETRFGATGTDNCGVDVTYDGRSIWQAR